MGVPKDHLFHLVPVRDQNIFHVHYWLLFMSPYGNQVKKRYVQLVGGVERSCRSKIVIMFTLLWVLFKEREKSCFVVQIIHHGFLWCSTSTLKGHQHRIRIISLFYYLNIQFCRRETLYFAKNNQFANQQKISVQTLLYNVLLRAVLLANFTNMLLSVDQKNNKTYRAAIRAVIQAFNVLAGRLHNGFEQCV